MPNGSSALASAALGSHEPPREAGGESTAGLAAILEPFTEAFALSLWSLSYESTSPEVVHTVESDSKGSGCATGTKFLIARYVGWGDLFATLLITICVLFLLCV